MTPGRRAIGEVLAAAAALYLGAALFAVGLQPAATETWQVQASNALATSVHQFGGEVVTSFGPLGYLVTPPGGGPLAVRAMAFQVAISALIAVAAWALLRRATLFGLFAGLAALLYAGSLGLGGEHHVWLALLLVAAWLVASASAIPAAILGTLAAVLLYVNLGSGAMAAALLLGSLAATYAAPPRPTVRPLLFAVLFGGILGVGLAPALLGSLGQLVPFLEQGAQIAAGASAGLSRAGPPDQVWFAVAAAVLFLADVVLLWQLEEGLAVRALFALAPAVFVAFKIGFVPQDPGVVGYFAAAAVAAGVATLLAGSLRAVIYSAGLLLCCGVLGAFASVPHELWAPQRLAALALLERASHELADLKTPEQRWSAPVVVRPRPAWRELPDGWLRLIEERGGSVDAMPAEQLAEVFRHKLRWLPSPTIDGRLAGTPALDAIAAAHFRGPRAPDFLIVALGAPEAVAGVESADLRTPLLDRPQAWRAIRDRYQVAATDDRTQRVLLRKKDLVRERTFSAQPRTFGTAGAPVQVPKGGEAGLVSLTLHVSLKARLLRAAFRLDPIHVRLKYADGKEALYRVLPDLAEQGLALGSLPRTAAELAAWMKGDGPAVKSFVLAGPGRESLDEVVGVQWMLPGK